MLTDKDTTIEQIKKLAREFAHDRDWEKYHTPKDLAVAISTEAAEILEHYRFRNGEELKEYIKKNKQEISYEIADVMTFLVRLADVSGIDISKSLEEKMKLNMTRFPLGSNI